MTKSKIRRKPKDTQLQLNGVFFRGFKPQTIGQNDYVRSVAENTISIIDGCAGTGKTYQAIGLACQYLLDGVFKNVLYSRTIVPCDGNLGYLPGTIEEKCQPYFIPAMEYFEYFIGKEKTESLIKYNNLKFFPLEMIKGQTHNDTLMILDEAQNVTKKQMKLFLSRIGKGSKIIVLGDEKQSDIGPNGFEFCCRAMTDVDNVGIVRLGYQDIMRHPIIAHILEIFEKQGI
jgi:phosphate starvation-inducible PhoH-like protein